MADSFKKNSTIEILHLSHNKLNESGFDSFLNILGNDNTSLKDLDISYRVLHPAAIIMDEFSGRNIRVPFSSLTSKYKDFLSEIVVEVELDENEQIDYLFKPKSLSNYLYGTFSTSSNKCTFVSGLRQ